MKKLDYGHPKVQEIIQMLIDLGYSHSQYKDSIDVIIEDRVAKKKVSHELHKIFHEYKSPPLTTSYDESSKILSIFDQRV